MRCSFVKDVGMIAHYFGVVNKEFGVASGKWRVATGSPASLPADSAGTNSGCGALSEVRCTFQKGARG
jgi:hypothetical protein